MSAADIAHSFGGRRVGSWWRAICPVHRSRTGSLSLAVRDGTAGGLIVHCHAGCDPHDVLAALRRNGMLDGRSRDAAPGGSRVALANGDDDAPRHRIALAQRIWDAAQDARGSQLMRYLAGRGIPSPVPASLRWAPALRRPDGSYTPAMVARIDGLGGELIGVQRTWLDRGPDGLWQRRDRAMLGHAAGGAVRHSLAAMQVVSTPGWAALSTSGMVAQVLPAIVRTVIIVADHDVCGVRQDAAA